VVPFAELRAGDLPLVGGKGANLGELLHEGFPVPDGFCVTTRAYERFLAGVPDLDGLFESVRGLDVEDVVAVRDVGTRIRAALSRAELPAGVAHDVRAAWARAGTATAFAVRSSATAEDLPDASFAGQQDTILDVRGEEDLLRAIQACWVSLFTDRAIVYRARNGFDPQAVLLAVVVQRMVPADVSGVLFTVDPVTQHRHTLVIDAAEGLGEALVAGRVVPDAYRVDRRGMRLLERRLGDREGAATSGPVLDDARILELARLGRDVEAHFGRPQDLEWAFAGGHLQLLQARPITSLYPVDALRSPDGALHVHFSVGHQQSMTRAMPTLSLSSLVALLPGGRGPLGLSSSYLHAAGGRLYADLTPALRHPIARRGVLGMLSQLDALAPEAVRAAMRRPDFTVRPRTSLAFGRIRFLLGIARRVAAAAIWRDLTGFRERTEARMDAFEAEARGRMRAAKPGRERGEVVLEEVRSIFPYLLTFVPVVAAGVASTRILTRLARPWLEADQVEALTLGIPGNAVNEMNLAIDDLAEIARRSPDVAERLGALGGDAHAWLAATAEVSGGDGFLAAFRAFLARYGARGAAEIDLSMPRWREDPLPVLRVVAAALRRDGPSYRERVVGYEAGRVVAFERLVAAAGGGPLGPLRVRAMRRLYRTMLEVGGMREHHKFLAIRVLAAAKEVVTEMAERLVERGALEHRDDVWFLTWPELLDAGEGGGGDLRPAVTRRRAVHARHARLAPPLIVTSDGEVPAVAYRDDGAPDGALLGDPVSSGVAEGTARVVRDPLRDELAPGEILVAEFTDPGWTPLFINAAGLVLEVGGALTHGAVVAREYGIPAVVGVRGATDAIRSGQRVRVDGGRGVVEVVDEA
jgi:pyruvate,water dikinase